jgi:hypothetical protein
VTGEAPATTEASTRYLPVGKRAFGQRLVFTLIASVAMTWLAWRILGEDLGSHLTTLLLGLFWLTQSAWMILAPQRSREDAFTGPSLRTIRLCGIVGLIFFTAITTLEIQYLARI